MSLKKTVLSLLLFLSANIAFGQGANNKYKQYRVLVLLDGSSSMLQQWNEKKSRFQTAGDIITKLMDSVYKFNPEVEFALRVYGHQHGVPENNCFDTKREVMFSKNNYTQMMLRLADLKPAGVSPIAYSLKTAAESDFTDDYNYAYSLILITDGGESCGGNICDVVKTLLDKKIQFKPYIISLVDYAPLKSQYDCLGNYLMASNPAEMIKTVGDIAEDYRKILRKPILKPQIVEAPKTKPQPPKTVTVPEIVVKKDTTPVQPTIQTQLKKENIAKLKTITQPRMTSKPIVWHTFRKRTIPGVTLPLKEADVQVAVTPKQDPPIVVKKDNIARLQTNRTIKLLIQNNIRPAALRKRSISSIALPVKEEEPVVITKAEMARLKTNAQLRSFGLFWSTPSLKKRPIPRVKLPINEETPTIGSASTTKPPVRRPVAPDKSMIKDASYSVTTEPAKETTLEIYFTDGKGKYYQTAPAVVMEDAKTGQEIKKFYRTVNPQGNPDPQNVPAGSYTLLIGKKANFRAKSITILPNNKNKVSIIAVNGTLSFKYTTNYKRPIDEFTALVKKNFEPGPVFNQACDEEKQYAAGNYHIEVNTLPISRRNLDIDFGTDFIIEIDEPGYVSFTNTNAFGKAALYFQNGDMFSKFYTLDINGNPALQKVRLQPGAYEVRFKDNDVFQSTMEKTVKFFVTSNNTTEILLQ